MNFLRRHLPPVDEHLPRGFLEETVTLAIKARRATSLDEPRDKWRSLMMPLFSPLVENASSITEAAQILNRDIWKIWGIHFVPGQTPAIMSPSQVIQAGFASCTGLSIFLVDACRSVGIPARVAGTPDWLNWQQQQATARRRRMAQVAEAAVAEFDSGGNGKRQSDKGVLNGLARRDGGPRPTAFGAGLINNDDDDDDDDVHNHNWVEVWDGRDWSFTGAAELDARGFNRTWFFPQPAKGQIPHDRLHSIFASSYMPTGTSFTLAWNWNVTWVQAVDVTENYLHAKVP
ncbi:hypothetical protein CEUSTIGMA_g11344.t1 [Chlamydomonas eustigma]|uniref:Transglutaminase-like domain-containing protein n=1 Tax=Chlamydomonas eustigma TaxID=1157962 RepID=A0A250XMA6_9CHLO|nr:hypothetical protein CEUSTIGMA_g11344.t1 [Chlamydomonas eustigma]|eukprot:GAX83920.1 hypothetical protein CEUSTIGMA_g11344.t1 [Chlamydomonas eustigma]